MTEEKEVSFACAFCYEPVDPETEAQLAIFPFPKNALETTEPQYFFSHWQCFKDVLHVELKGALEVE